MSGSGNFVVKHRVVDGTAVPGLAGHRVAAEVFLPVQRALDAAATVVLGAGELLSMLPGNVAAEAAGLRVPVPVMNGEHHLVRNDQHPRAEQYPEAADFATYALPSAGRDHNIAPTRHQLWEQLRRFAGSVVPA